MTSARSFPFQYTLILLLLVLLGFTEVSSAHPDGHNPDVPLPEQKTIVIEHVTVLVVPGVTTLREHHGLEAERDRLMQTLQRNKGKWDSNHPRYRLLTALKGYLHYKQRSTADLDKWRTAYKKLPRKERSFVESRVRYSKKLNTVEHLLDKNADIARAIVESGLDFYGIEMKELQDFIVETKDEPINDSKTNVLQAVKHFVRDWSDEGLYEREPTFPCILNAIQSKFPVHSRSGNESSVKILVPGAGLGRLAHEVASLGGFEVTVNEWSSYMNLAYRYLLTRSTPHTASFHPFIDWWSHRVSTASLTRAVTFPDISPALAQPSILLVEGDFTTALSKSAGTYDAVVTLFFIDTAKNIFSYLQTIHAMLRPGGVWINFGPLLYGTNPSLQLSLDEVVALAEGLGFEFEETSEDCGDVTAEGLKVRGKEVPYGSDEESLAKNAYLAQHWVARKK